MRCSTLSLGVHGHEYSYMERGQWQASLAYRWLHSDRHFLNGEEQRHRQEEGSEVINDVHTFDVTATYAFDKRFTIGLTIPFVNASRSSLYEHDRTNRHTTVAGGLGDMRLVGTMWLLPPDKFKEGNVALGLGVKFPTGEYKATDTRHRPTGDVLDYVDNSIQPGDGGWGVLLEIQAFQKVWENTFAYMNGTYLLNPQEQTSIGNSIWDAYVGRAGLHYAIWPSKGIALSLGGRVEGVPPEDAIGGSRGRRRPGYAISIEPGITWAFRRATFNLSAPVALYRHRQRNFAGDEGDAAFADYLILASISYRF